MSEATFAQAPIPLQDPIARKQRFPGDPLEGIITQTWLEYFSRLVTVVENNPVRVGADSLTAQTASITATDVSAGTLGAGIYRVSYYAQITQAAGTSSSLTVTLDWTAGGIAQAYSGAAMTGNLTTTNQSGSLLIYVDNLSPIRYSTTYASAGAPVMQYMLHVVLEEIKA